MAELDKAGRELSRALEQVNKCVSAYFDAALTVGRESGDPTARGLDARQLRQKLQSYIIAKLSPRVGLEKPLLQFHGAPEARRYVAAHPLPGVS